MFYRPLARTGLTLTVLALTAGISRADLLKNFKVDGSLETRSFGIGNEIDRNDATDDYRSETRSRVRLGASSDLLDDVHARVSVTKNNRLYGGGSENLNTVQSNLVLDNAFVTIDKVFGHVDLSMGRQFYGNDQDLVIYFGPQNDDVLTVTAVDVFRADAALGSVAKFQGIAGKVSDTGTTGTNASNNDTDLWGAEVNTDKVIPQGNLAAYYYNRAIKRAASTFSNDLLQVTGLRAAGKVLGLGYKAEVIQNFGRNNTFTPAATQTNVYNGSAYFLGLNYGAEVAGMPFRASAEYGRGSRDFTAVAAGRRFGKIWGEHTSLSSAPNARSSGPSGVAATGTNNGLTNLKVADVSLGINPIAKLGIDVTWYRFQYASNVGGAGTSAGTEYDLVVSWKHSDNVSLEASAATFQVGDGMKNLTTTTRGAVSRLGADVKIKF